jgi:hypothetical protein
MRKTGQTVKERGLYISECCDNEQIFEIGDNFTRCLKCMSLTEWELDSELVTDAEFEDRNGIAA